MKRLIAGAALLALAGGAVAQQWVVTGEEEAEHLNDSAPHIPVYLAIWTAPRSGHHVVIHYPSPECSGGKKIDDDQTVSLNGRGYEARKTCNSNEINLDFNYFVGRNGESDASLALEEIKTDKPIVVQLYPTAPPIVFMNPNGKWASETVKVLPYDMGGS